MLIKKTVKMMVDPDSLKALKAISQRTGMSFGRMLGMAVESFVTRIKEGYEEKMKDGN